MLVPEDDLPAALETFIQIRAVPYDFMAALGSMGCHRLPVLANINHSWSYEPTNLCHEMNKGMSMTAAECVKGQWDVVMMTLCNSGS